MKTGTQSLVNNLMTQGVLTDEYVREAFLQIDRSDFVPDESKSDAYANYPLRIGFGQTISQPYTVAFMLDLLEPRPGNKILDIGSGSGWTTALLAKIAGNEGKVIGLEIVPQLVKFGRGNIKKYPSLPAEIRQARNGELGISGEKFDRILVSASADHFPEELTDQMASPSRLVLPVRDSIFAVSKDSQGNISKQQHHGFVFVPLV